LKEVQLFFPVCRSVQQTETAIWLVRLNYTLLVFGSTSGDADMIEMEAHTTLLTTAALSIHPYIHCFLYLSISPVESDLAVSKNCTLYKSFPNFFSFC